MKRIPAFLLAGCLALSIILPVSAFESVLEEQSPFLSAYVLIDHPDGSYNICSFDSVISTFSTSLPLDSLYAVSFNDANGGRLSALPGPQPELVGVGVHATNTAWSGYFCGFGLNASGGDIITVFNVQPWTFANILQGYSALPSIAGSSPSFYYCSGGSASTGSVYVYGTTDSYFHQSSLISLGSAVASGSVDNNNYTFSFTVPSDYSGLIAFVCASGHYGGVKYRVNTGSEPGSVELSSFIDSLVSALPDYALDTTLRELIATNQLLATESTSQKILSAIQSLVQGQGVLTPMDQFEADYLEKFDDQISKTESALSSSNPALPNGADVGGFVSDLQDGLGVTGDSFSMSDFNGAVGSFSGSASTSEDGPWWFFSDEVVSDLSGDVSSFGFDDDWFWSFYEEFDRRLKAHGIGSVGS